MARFRGGLNCEIQDILDYKEYADMTQSFEFACKAEHEVEDHVWFEDRWMVASWCDE
jgi:hypothetical protein